MFTAGISVFRKTAKTIKHDNAIWSQVSLGPGLDVMASLVKDSTWLERIA